MRQPDAAAIAVPRPPQKKKTTLHYLRGPDGLDAPRSKLSSIESSACGNGVLIFVAWNFFIGNA